MLVYFVVNCLLYIYIYVGYKLLAIYINLHAWLAILEASQKIKIIQKYKYNLSTRILKKTVYKTFLHGCLI